MGGEDGWVGGWLAIGGGWEDGGFVSLVWVLVRYFAGIGWRKAEEKVYLRMYVCW